MCYSVTHQRAVSHEDGAGAPTIVAARGSFAALDRQQRVPSVTRRRRTVAIALGAGVLAGLCVLYQLARSPKTQLFGTLVSRVETTDRVVALTFDDGPVLDTLEEVLEMLRILEVRATFFVTGSELAEAPEAARRLVQAGHELGNHSYSHRRMVLKSLAFVRREVERTDQLIRDAGHRGEIFFRPPYGKKLVVLPWYLWRAGRTSVTWDVDADSAVGRDATVDAIAGRVVARVRPGSIVLFHVWYPSRSASRAAVPLVVKELRDRGFRFVTLGQLLAAG
jgi:peptidoglycan/xylan/chitin deacetylase (PgdA/CDA1 family)